MSLNQSRPERSESSQHRKSGRSGSSAQSRNFSGSSGKGGAAAPPPSSSSINSSLPSSRSFKKTNNAHGGQSRVSGISTNFVSNNVSAARTQQNGSRLQPPPHGGADTPISGVSAKPESDMSTQKSGRAVPNIPAPKPAVASSDSAPSAAFAKGQPPGEASKIFPLQFGSISAGLGMQVPARTSSAPPNLHEQQRDQARYDALGGVPTFPIPSVPKQQMSRKEGGGSDKSKTGEAHQTLKAKRDLQVSSAPSVAQAEKTSVHAVTGVSMSMPYHQPQVPVQFGGATPQIPSQGMSATSLPMHMPMPLSMGNAPQLQRPVFVPGMQPHPMQPAGIMPQGQSMNFSSQMSPQLPHQLGNMGMVIGPQFAQQQAGKFGGARKPVKITHPKTHEELRLDKKADAYAAGGSSGPRSHSNLQQSQPITSVPPSHSVNYYSSYNPNSLIFTTPPGSVPLNGSQISHSSQAPRFSYPVNHGSQAVSFMNPPAHNTYSNKHSSSMHSITEPSSLEYSRDIHTSSASTPSASARVTIKPAIGLHAEKVAKSSLATGLSPVEKDESPKSIQQRGEVDSMHIQRVSETCLESSSTQPTPGSTSSSLPESGIQSISAPRVLVKDTETNSSSSVLPATLEESVPVVTAGTENRRETVSRSDSIGDQEKEQIKKEDSQPQHEVDRQSSSVSSLPSQSVDHTNPSNTGTAETIATNIACVSSNGGLGAAESVSEPLSICGSATAGASEFKTESNEQGSTQVSSKMFGSLSSIDNLDTDYLNRESPKGEPLNLEAVDTKGGIVLNEGTEGEKNCSETSSGSISLKSLVAIGQTQPNSPMKLVTTSHEVGSLETFKDLEKAGDDSKKDDMWTDNLPTSTSSRAVDATNAKTSSSISNLSMGPDGGSKTSTSEASLSRHDGLGRRQIATKSIPSEEVAAPVSVVSSASEATLKHDAEGSEDVNLGFVPPPSSKDKPMPELSKSKSNVARGKKKRKEILQKADALGTTSDLYNAYKGPEEKKETVVSSESAANTDSSTSKQVSINANQDDVSSGKYGPNKAEPDDWEDAADISTPKLDTVDDGKHAHGGSKNFGEDGNGATSKKYSRDFLLKFSEQCIDLPEGFEITSDIAEALLVSNVNASRESFASPGRIIDRPSGAPRLDRRGTGIGDDGKWSRSPGPINSGRDLRMDGYGGNFRPGQGGNYGVLRNPRVQIPAQYAGGILSAPMHSLGSQGGAPRNGPDADRWQRATAFQKGLIPSPQTPLQVMHKADKRYEVVKVTDEEQAKQRKLKAILNKLTPQNFEKLFEQVKAVNIDSTTTLTGAISQIFDKALMEPTFCEMYADFCVHLARELPNFNEDNEKITFKRLLLNKCQEEFERDEREQEEAERADEEGGVKQSEEEREEKRIKARRRMLGNIRLIGELYKKKMLTERIMHDCIKKLLGQYQNPDEENIEALCKLMSTIGEIIDYPKTKAHMDAYFDMMAKLSNNMKLSSRVRFMLKDAIDLRKNKWQQRRKVEGPKKIEEVHRDAAQERQVQAGRLARGPNISSSARNRQPTDFGYRGSSMLSSPNAQMGSFRGVPTQVRSYVAQDVRLDESRHSFDNRTHSLPLPQRSGEDSITLGPQGGLARGMSGRGQPLIPNIPSAEVPGPGDSRRIVSGLNGYGSVSDRTVYGPREEITPRYTDRFLGPYDQSGIQERNMYHGNRDARNADRNLDRSRPTSPIICNLGPTDGQDVSSDNVWPEERLRNKSLNAIKEFYSAKDEKEVSLCVRELNAPSFYPTMISIWVGDSFERKDTERDLLSKLLINLSRPQDGMLNQDHLIKGFESVLATLEDAVNDAPRAAEYLGQLYAKLIVEKVIPFSEIGQLILEGGEEKGSLVEYGLAADVVGAVLETIQSEKGESVLSEIRTSSSVELEKFLPPNSTRPLRLDKFI